MRVTTYLVTGFLLFACSLIYSPHAMAIGYQPPDQWKLTATSEMNFSNFTIIFTDEN